MSCTCEHCKYSAKVKENLKGLNDDQKEFFREMMNRLVNTEFELSILEVDREKIKEFYATHEDDKTITVGYLKKELKW